MCAELAVQAKGPGTSDVLVDEAFEELSVAHGVISGWTSRAGDARTGPKIALPTCKASSSIERLNVGPPGDWLDRKADKCAWPQKKAISVQSEVAGAAAIADPGEDGRLARRDPFERLALRPRRDLDQGVAPPAA